MTSNFWYNTARVVSELIEGVRSHLIMPPPQIGNTSDTHASQKICQTFYKVDHFGEFYSAGIAYHFPVTGMAAEQAGQCSRHKWCCFLFLP